MSAGGGSGDRRRSDPLRSGAIFRPDFLQSIRSPVPSFSSPRAPLPWSKQELAALRDAVQVRVAPTERQFWRKVAGFLPGRSSADCQQRWFEEVEEEGTRTAAKKAPPKRKREEPPSDGEKENEQVLANTGGAGSIKAEAAGKKGGRGRGKKAKLREMVREYAKGGSDDDLFESTPVKNRRLSGNNLKGPSSLLRLSFLEEELSSDEGAESSDEEERHELHPGINDQYLNRVISQVRPKNRREAEELEEERRRRIMQQGNANPYGSGFGKKGGGLSDLRVNDRVGGFKVQGKLDWKGSLQAKVRRDGWSDSGEEDGEASDEDMREEEEEEELRGIAGRQWMGLLQG